MRLLLDTHVVIWAFADDPRLPPRVRRAIHEEDHEVMVSAVSAWEVAIKQAIGKLEAPTDFMDQVDAARFRPLPITCEHGLEAGALPRHHGDPFDRMLIAQARLESLTLVTVDDRMRRYNVAVLDL